MIKIRNFLQKELYDSLRVNLQKTNRGDIKFRFEEKLHYHNTFNFYLEYKSPFCDAIAVYAVSFIFSDNEIINLEHNNLTFKLVVVDESNPENNFYKNYDNISIDEVNRNNELLFNDIVPEITNDVVGKLTKQSYPPLSIKEIAKSLVEAANDTGFVIIDFDPEKPILINKNLNGFFIPFTEFDSKNYNSYTGLEIQIDDGNDLTILNSEKRIVENKLIVTHVEHGVHKKFISFPLKSFNDKSVDLSKLFK